MHVFGFIMIQALNSWELARNLAATVRSWSPLSSRPPFVDAPNADVDGPSDDGGAVIARRWKPSPGHPHAYRTTFLLIKSLTRRYV